MDLHNILIVFFACFVLIIGQNINSNKIGTNVAPMTEKACKLYDLHFIFFIFIFEIRHH